MAVAGTAMYGLRRLTFSLGCLALAAIVFKLFFVGGPPPPPEPVPEEEPVEDIGQEIRELCPGDPELAARMCQERLYVALRVARKYGREGLVALDVFGEDAVFLFERDPGSFEYLVSVPELEEPLDSALTGPWKEAVLAWALAGKLGHFLELVKSLGTQERAILQKVPGSLGLLQLRAPQAKRMLVKHGCRAWHLFLAIDISEGAHEAESVAEALDAFGVTMLEVNERYGLGHASMFVAPEGDREQAVPKLLAYAIEKLGSAEAIALFWSNYGDLTKLLLEEHVDPGQVQNAISLLAGQLPLDRKWAPDSPYVIRLLLEERSGEPVGLKALQTCGPQAANFLYDPRGYANERQDVDAALLLMTRLGYEGQQLLETFHGCAAWHQLIRRGELCEPWEDPLLPGIGAKLHSSLRADLAGPQSGLYGLLMTESAGDMVARFAQMPVKQIREEQYPPTLGEQVLDWVPGYVAYRVVRDKARGYHVRTGEMVFGAIDGIASGAMLRRVLRHAVGEAGRAAARKAQRVAAASARQEAMEMAERKLAGELGRWGGRKGAGRIVVQMPGGLAAFMDDLGRTAGDRKATDIMRASSAIARKTGVKTWSGASLAELKSDMKWNAAGESVCELGPWIVEMVNPLLRKQP